MPCHQPQRLAPLQACQPGWLLIFIHSLHRICGTCLQACQSGMRSTMATSQLADKYTNLVNFKGSFGAWTAANMPVEK